MLDLLKASCKNAQTLWSRVIVRVVIAQMAKQVEMTGHSAAAVGNKKQIKSITGQRRSLTCTERQAAGLFDTMPLLPYSHFLLLLMLYTGTLWNLCAMLNKTFLFPFLSVNSSGQNCEKTH